MKKWLVSGIIILAGLLPVWAEDHVGDNPDRVALRQPRVRYVRTLDPSKFVCLSGETCTTFPEAITAAQWAIWDGATRKDHLKVVDGVLVEMDAAEKQAVNDALAAPTLVLQPFKDELAQSGICANALSNISADVDAFYDPRVAAIQAQIDLVTNVATAKAALEEINQRYSQERIVTKKLARCVAALIKVLGR